MTKKEATPECVEALNRIERFFDDDVYIKLIDPVCLCEDDGQYFIIFQKTQEKVRYTIEGFSILKAIENTWVSLNELSEEFFIDPHILKQFLLHEILNKRVKFQRND